MTDYRAIAIMLVQNPNTHAVNFDDPQDACGVFMELDRMYGPLIHNINEYRRMNAEGKLARMHGFRCVSDDKFQLDLLNLARGRYPNGISEVTTVYRSGDFQAELDTTTLQLDLSDLLGGAL